jgi:hypothetical protein
MVRANSPDYGPMGALRVERVTKPDGRYVLYYTWPDAPDSPAGRAPAAREPDASRSDNAPVRKRTTHSGFERSDGGV